MNGCSRINRRGPGVGRGKLPARVSSDSIESRHIPDAPPQMRSLDGNTQVAYITCTVDLAQPA